MACFCAGLFCCLFGVFSKFVGFGGGGGEDLAQGVMMLFLVEDVDG